MNNELREQSFNRDIFDEMVSNKLKLIRTEADLTQDGMAEVIGISKKTLVQVEKGRKTLGFTQSALVAILFRHGDIVQSLFGDITLEIVELISNHSKEKKRYRTLGGKVWWTEEVHKDGFYIQKHVLTGHYRIIDENQFLFYYSLNQSEAYKRLEELTNNKKEVKG